MAAIFPDGVWDGLTRTRLRNDDYQSGAPDDLCKIILELKAVQRYLIDNPPDNTLSDLVDQLILDVIALQSNYTDLQNTKAALNSPIFTTIARFGSAINGNGSIGLYGQDEEIYQYITIGQGGFHFDTSISISGEISSSSISTGNISADTITTPVFLGTTIIRKTGGTAGVHETQITHTINGLEFSNPGDSSGIVARFKYGGGTYINVQYNDARFISLPITLRSGDSGGGGDVSLERAASAVLAVKDGGSTYSLIQASGYQLMTAAGVSRGKAGGTIFNDYTDISTTHTDGTEDNLYSYTTVANTLVADGDSIHEIEHVQFVSSATAARRLKKYFAGTLILDSGSLTLTLGGDFWIETTVIRESSTVVRCSVNVVTTSASIVPYVTYTRITGLTLNGTNILKTTGIASGTGAASGDIINKLAKVSTWPTA